jgi:hypothetical protein
MKLSDTKEYQDFLSVLKNVKNEGLRVALEDSVFEIVQEEVHKAWGVGYAAGCEKGYQAGKSGK